MNKKLFLLMAVSMLLAACGAPPKTQLRYIYPLPPEQPRVEWLGTYASQDDFPKTDAERAMEKLVGKPPLQTMTGAMGIVSDGEGKVFVADMYVKDLHVFDFTRRKVEPFLKEPLLVRPYGLAIDAQKRIYVADGGGQKVLVFSRDAKLLQTIGNAQELTNPVAVEVDDARQRLYVSDAAGGRVQVYDLAGKRLFTFGEQPGAGKLVTPQGLATGPDGNLYVADTLSASIKVFSADGSFVRTLGQRGDAMGSLAHPRDVAFDSEGHLWVVDHQKPYLQIFATDGTFLLAVGSAQTTTHKMGFGSATTITITPTDEVYVSDFAFRRFSHWQYLSQSFLKRRPFTDEEMQLLRQFVPSPNPAN